jgi:FkbM family methyltransferase
MITEKQNTPPFSTYSLSGWRHRLLTLAQHQRPSWLGRRLALIARRMVLRGRTDPVDAISDGFRIRAHVTDNVSERKFLFMPRFVDPAERAYVVEHLTPDGVFLDIGANAGIYTLTAARAYSGIAGSGYVLAVEANPTMQERFNYNVALNDLENYVRLAPIALSNKDGEVAFSLSNQNLGESGLLETGGQTIRVPALTLSNLLATYGVSRIDGMKIDVEGMEDVILAPFLEQAHRSQLPGFIIIENSADRWHVDLLRLLAVAGYREHDRCKMNLILSLGMTDQAN